MKKGLFGKIVYFLFTFSIGIILALFLPYFYMYYGESINMIADSLNKGEYSDAMRSVGGYYNQQYVFRQDFEKGGGIVLFEAATLIPGPDTEEGPGKADANIHLAYGGFLYGLEGVYDMSAYQDNLAKIVITDSEGQQSDYKILDYDDDRDGKPDSNATYLQRGFFFVDFDKDTYPTIQSVELLDCKGNSHAKVTVNLTFSEAFFEDVSPFVEEYNMNFKSEKLKELDRVFREKDENYQISSTEIVKSSADKKSTIIVVVYFVVIYVIADFLFSRYILKFFRWFLFKVCKIKPKQRPVKNPEAFGHDYYSKVNFVLDTSQVEGFNQSVQIRYTDENGEEISFLLMKENNYNVTERIKAGTYVNMWIDLDKTIYATENLPETLCVEGYQKGFKIKIIKRED